MNEILDIQDPDNILAVCFISTAVTAMMYASSRHDQHQKLHLLAGLAFGATGGSLFASNLATFIFIWLFGGVIGSLSSGMIYCRWTVTEQVAIVEK